MPVTRRQLWMTTVGLAVLWFIAWKLWPTRHEPTALEVLAADFVRLSTPDDGAVVLPVSVKRETWRVTASWEIETRREWKEYTAWLSSKLGTDFRKLSETEHLVEFRKTLPAEMLVVRSERGRDDPPNRVRMSLIVEPW